MQPDGDGLPRIQRRRSAFRRALSAVSHHGLYGLHGLLSSPLSGECTGGRAVRMRSRALPQLSGASMRVIHSLHNRSSYPQLYLVYSYYVHGNTETFEENPGLPVLWLPSAIILRTSRTIP